MNLLVLLGIAVGLSMDCLAVSMACGTRLKTPTTAQTARLAAAFAFAQAAMPVIGWAAGRTIVGMISAYDHWVAFALLAFIGGKMVYEYFGGEESEETGDPTVGRELFILAIATSLDALAVGLSLAVLNAGIVLPALLIGATCFVITVIGVKLGVKASEVWGRRMELVGGLVLIGIGARILLEHLEIV
ncbi:MAG: manganese efflux pump MntP family protein [Myxococcota bacterium]